MRTAAGQWGKLLSVLAQGAGSRQGAAADDGSSDRMGIAVKLPEGWRVWLLVLGLNGLAGWLWFIDRGVEPPAPGGSLWALIRSLASGG